MDSAAGAAGQHGSPSTPLAGDRTRVARHALEEVCSGKDPVGIEQVYSPRFIDHVNALEYHGTEGARTSVAL